MNRMARYCIDSRRMPACRHYTTHLRSSPFSTEPGWCVTLWQSINHLSVYLCVCVSVCQCVCVSVYLFVCERTCVSNRSPLRNAGYRSTPSCSLLRRSFTMRAHPVGRNFHLEGSLWVFWSSPSVVGQKDVRQVPGLRSIGAIAPCSPE